MNGSDRFTDSAGTPWAGRHFTPTAFDGDDGSAPPVLLEALRGFRARRVGAAAVVDAARGVRLLVPLLAQLGETGIGPTGKQVDKSAELALVTVAGPDGRRVLPAFTSVEAMRVWNPSARPVPAESERVALAAAAEDTDLVVLDAGSETEFVLRRPAVWALGRGTRWIPPHEDRELAAEFAATSADPAVVDVRLVPGDPDSRLRGPELRVELRLELGLDRDALDALLARLGERWSASTLIAERVDSLAVTVLAG
ncbi:SseB family protein [Naasia sp. SYSU D00057]|uniref:SseB family protein n=1 Tax=Naasia sp. SYSU D00057 TaxID=2817380 RepID=UPI001B3071AC|nr:SseB family protein [Naasia sp. SYSU D00057]